MICHIHAAAITHHETVEAPLSTQNIGKEFVIHVVGNSIPFIIGSHNVSCVGFCYRHFESIKGVLAKFTFRIIYRSDISAAFWLAMAGKMFQCNSDMMIIDECIAPLESKDRRHSKPRY